MIRSLAILILFTVSTVARAATADTIVPVNARIAEHENRLRYMPGMAFGNPATRQWMLPVSYSSISVGYSHEDGNRAVDPQAGKGHDIFSIGADSYMKYRSSTLWGSAAYTNGRMRDIRWNESSDIETVGPYLIADSIGGDMRCESYSFAGGYADHSDRWGWGVTLGYTAGLYYRNVDPRPRNTTNRLDITAGASLRIGSGPYRAGIALHYQKYKQTGSLEFVNEMSDNRIWHLTGLGTHYERFEGLGYSHYYNGNRFGVSADLFPQNRRGLSVVAGWSRMSIDHILTALNKLPLQTLTDNDLSAQGTWLAPGRHHDWSIGATLRYGRRSGTENIFGDPSAGIYPQIGKLDMYSRTRISVSGKGLWQWRPVPGTILAVEPQVEFNSDRQKYADPQRRLDIDRLIPSMRIFASRGFGPYWRAAAEVRAAFSVPIGSSVHLPWEKQSPAGLQMMEKERADILTKNHSTYGLQLSGSRAVTDRYALRISVSGDYSSYAQSVHSYGCTISAAFIF